MAKLILYAWFFQPREDLCSLSMRHHSQSCNRCLSSVNAILAEFTCWCWLI